MGSTTADRRAADPYDHYQQQQQQQQPPLSPQQMQYPQQMSQQASCSSTQPAIEAREAESTSAVDRARVASMLDALVIQQPLFMSNKYIKLADLNR